MYIGLLVLILIICSTITLMASIVTLQEKKYNIIIGLPINFILLIGWFWVIGYCGSEPQFVIEEKVRTVQETTKETGQRVQWFYDFNDSYQQLEGVRDGYKDMEVVVIKSVEQNREGVRPNDPINYSFKVRMKGVK